MRTTIVYGVCDPRTGALRYVGKTGSSLRKRMATHMRADGRSHRAFWFASLRAANVAPDAFPIEVDPADWREAERFWIAYFRGLGADLVNVAEGGEGAICANRTSFRRGQKAWNEGKAHSAETRKRIGDVQRGKPKGPQSPAHRAKVGHANTGKTRGKPWSAARRAANAAQKRSHPWNPERRAQFMATIAARKA